MRRGLEREREDLRSQLQDATNEVSHPRHHFLSVRHDRAPAYRSLVCRNRRHVITVATRLPLVCDNRHHRNDSLTDRWSVTDDPTSSP